METLGVNLPGVTLLTNVPAALDVFVGEGGVTVIGPRAAMEEWVRINWTGKSDVPELWNFDQE